MTTIEGFTFNNCTSLESINLGNNLSTIETYAFKGCNSLKYIDLGDGIVELGNQCFRDCSNLETIKVEAKLTSIGASAFYGCNNLLDFYCYASTPPTIDTSYGSPSFSSTSDKTTLHIPIRSYSKYTSSKWRDYFKVIIDDID